MTEDLQNSSVDTVETTETVEEQGTVVVNKEDTTPVVETAPQIDMVPKTELEKARMRANQLENELARAREAAANAGNDELVESLQGRIDALQSEREQEEAEKSYQGFISEVENVFDKSLEKYPEAVKKAARYNKDSIGIERIVGEVSYGFQAEQNIKKYLDGLSKQLEVEPKPEIQVEAQNLPIAPNGSNEIEIGETSTAMGRGEEAFLGNIVSDAFKEIGVDLKK